MDAGDDRSASPDAAITFEDVGKRFGEQWVLEHVDLAVPRGAVFGLIGPSGCGKTTAVRLANGAYRPDAGSVSVLGRPASERRARERTSLGYLPQQPPLFEALSLWENLNFQASLNGVRFRRRERLRELLELVDLSEHSGKRVGEVSGGMRRRLALAATLVHRPPLIMLDEPTAGIDPILRRRFWEHFRALADQGHTFVITTQHIDEATSCDVVGLLAGGCVAAAGTPADLRRAAVGGELLEIETERPLDGATANAVATAIDATSYEFMGATRLRFVVDQAGATLPALLEALTPHGVTTTRAEEIVTPFDDVFIGLVQSAEEAA